MSWQLGGTPNVVDALDAQGRPMPVALPSNHGDLFSDGLDAYAVTTQAFQPIAVRTGWHPAVLILIGVVAGVIGAVAALWVLR